MEVLFANTGVQILCVPITGGRRYKTELIGHGWQYTRCRVASQNEDDDEEFDVVEYPYIQWQLIQGSTSRLYLVVDSTCGDPAEGYFCDPSALAGDFIVNLEGLLGADGEPLAGLGDVQFCLRASTAAAGEAKDAHLVIDFGNSRTGALILEMAGEISQTPQMMPFELANRFHLDAWDDEGEPTDSPDDRWFSSQTQWSTSPYLPTQNVIKKEYVTESVKGLLKKKEVTKQREMQVVPDLFEDYSQVRLGREVNDLGQLMHSEGDYRTAVSSPKRYLWADDPAWLEGANWYMTDPYDRCTTGTYGAKLQGPMLRFLHEDDRDTLYEKERFTEDDHATEVPVKPRHAPRIMMVAAIYELLCQAYTHVNSPAYRQRAGESARSRQIRSLTLTYPSGMIQEERERFRVQVQKAINIFIQTLGKNQREKPTLTFSIDEASAVHLTYIWSELRLLGQDAGLWFSLLAQDTQKKLGTAAAEEADEPVGAAAVAAAPAARRRNRARPRPSRPGAATQEPAAVAPPKKSFNEVRICCIDIGGGTSDLMIAKYDYQPGIDDSIRGQVLHQDGISLGGDQLVKRLLEKIVVPRFADAIGLEIEDVQLLFGPEVPKNRGFRPQRVAWTNRLFVPLAQAYLQLAVDDVQNEEISHTDPEIVDPTVLDTLEAIFDKLRGPGYYSVHQELGLTYDKAEFENVVHEVFDDLIFDYCTRAVDYQADVILLAGQPTKLSYIQELVRMYVPLPASRVIPMFNHYAGNWYPYQDAKGHNPGVIIDPKSAVVVGAAVEFLARHGMLPQFKFAMRGREKENSYYWGVMTDGTSGIKEERILFRPSEGQTTEEWTEFTTIAQRVIIGRKLSEYDESQATPVYLLKMDPGSRIGETEMTVKVRRKQATADEEESLEVESVSGMVAGEPAMLHENVHFSWRTLADERYYLDTGGLDNLEVDNY